MLFFISTLLLSIAPIAIAGSANMAFVKSPFLNGLKTPIDNGYIYRDGKPVFGANKTWKGAVGMIGLSGLTLWLFSILLGEHYSLWTVYRPAGDFKLVAFFDGLLLGLAYIVFELPNSFIKRRIDIGAGKNAQGKIGLAFTVIDQADSVIGCALMMLLITHISLSTAILIIVIGSGIHLILNGLLFLVGLKSQAR